MGRAKDIRVEPIASRDARSFMRRTHYSGKIVNNSQLHLGVFLDGKLEGAMQFGPSMDKRKTIGLVRDTPWNGFLELNRLAFTDALPRNSESRALGVAMRLIKKHYPHVQWILSYADATQCGDGTIYRAAGFVLTRIGKNTTIWKMPDDSLVAPIAKKSGKRGNIFNRVSATDRRMRERGRIVSLMTMTKGENISDDGAASMRIFKEAGAEPLPGYQLRYIYFLHDDARARLVPPIIPFAEIAERGAGMYKGEARAK